jgi:glycosyltransferase involved in cell wall biosynthesis
MSYSLSIIIPCFNESNTIEKLLGLVVSSPIENKQIIVVDDGGRYPAYYPIERLNANQYKVAAYYHDAVDDSDAEIVLLERISDTNRQE